MTLVPSSPESFPEEGQLHEALGNALGLRGQGQSRAAPFQLNTPRAAQAEPAQAVRSWSAAPSTHADIVWERGRGKKKSEDKLRLTSVFSPATPITPLQPNHSLPLQSRPICKRSSSQRLSAKAFNYCHLGGCARLPSGAFSYFSEDSASGLDAPNMPFVRLYFKQTLTAY